jgi:Na+-translocating ferredoxin:NAD+ oxidoreductase RnfD subunit
MLSRLPFGGMGQQLFHPAMVGSAVVLVLEQAATPALDPVLEVCAIVFAGTLLAWRLGRDLRAPLGMLLSFGAMATLMHATGRPGLAGAGGWPHLFLAACIVANDPVTTPSRAAARLVFGASAGLAAALLPGGVEALPFALLALQAVAPWLDRSAGARVHRPGRRMSGTAR